MGQYDMYFKNEINNFFNKNFSIWKKSITFAPVKIKQLVP